MIHVYGSHVMFTMKTFALAFTTQVIMAKHTKVAYTVNPLVATITQYSLKEWSFT